MWCSTLSLLWCTLHSSAKAFPYPLLQKCKNSPTHMHDFFQSISREAAVSHSLHWHYALQSIVSTAWRSVSSGRMQMNKWFGSLRRKEGTKLYRVSSAGYQVSRKHSREPSGFVPRKAVLLNKPVTDREAKGREGATWGTHIFRSHWAWAVFYYVRCIMWMTEWHWHHLLLLRNICCKRWGDPVTSNLLIFIGFLTAFLGKIFVV